MDTFFVGRVPTSPKKVGLLNVDSIERKDRNCNSNILLGRSSAISTTNSEWEYLEASLKQGYVTQWPKYLLGSRADLGKKQVNSMINHDNNGYHFGNGDCPPIPAKLCNSNLVSTCKCGTAFFTTNISCPQCGSPGAEAIPNTFLASERRAGLQNSIQACIATPVTSKALSDGASETTTEPNDEVTTLMIYDIPFKLTINRMVDVIDDHGFVGAYDFVYMPPSKGRSRNESVNIGYMFINFKLPEDASKFLSVFQNISFPDAESPKLTCTKAAHCQGYSANMDKHSKHGGSFFSF